MTQLKNINLKAKLVVATLLMSSILFGQNTLDKAGLTNVATASAAYSLRLLSSNYSGTLVRIYVSNTSKYYDVYPDASTNKIFSLSSPISASYTTYNAASTGATSNLLSSIIVSGTTNATVAIWFDQSGYANHAIQLNTAYQPSIISVGTIVITPNSTQSTLPAVNFNGSNNYLRAVLPSLSSTVPHTLNGVAAASQGTMLTLSSTPANTNNSCLGAGWAGYGNAWFGGWNQNNTYTSGTSATNNAIRTKVYIPSTSTINGYVDGINTFSNAPYTYNLNTADIVIGMQNNGNNQPLTGYASELIVFQSSLSNANRLALETNQGNYYNIPVISTSPTASNQTICGGSTAPSLSVTAFGSGLTYQWYSNTTATNSGGTNFGSTSGAQTATYTPSTLTAGTLYYYCVVSNSTGSVTSNVSGGVTVIANTAITTQPASNPQAVGINTSLPPLFLVANGVGALSYQWYSNTTNLNTGGTSISGATSATYTPSTTVTGTLYYYCTITSSCGASVSSNVSGPVVVAQVLDKVGLTNSAPADAAYGLRLLSTSYTGPLVRIAIGSNYYDVYPDVSTNQILSTNSAISAAYTTYNAASTGATSNHLSSVIAGVSATVAIWYDQSGLANNAIQATNANQPEIIHLGIIDLANGLPAVTFTNISQYLLNSSTVSTIQTVNAVRNLLSTGCQYLFSAPALTDFSIRAHNSFNTPNGANIDYYWVGPGTLNSNDWAYNTGNIPTNWVDGVQTLAATTTLHTITASSLNAITNTSFSINNNFYGRGMTGGDAVSELFVFPPSFSNANRQTLEANQNNYYAFITSQPSATPQILCLGTAATSLNVTALGSPLSYQWYSNTVNSNVGGTAIAGATSSSYIPTTTTAGTLYYYAVITSLSATVTSAVSGSVTVNTVINTQPSTSFQTVSQSATAATLNVVATGTGLTYQWYLNTSSSTTGATSIAGATNASYTPSTAIIGTLYYYCVITSACGNTITSAVSGAVNTIVALDNIGLAGTTSAAAYSLRLLSSGYHGPLVRIRIGTSTAHYWDVYPDTANNTFSKNSPISKMYTLYDTISTGKVTTGNYKFLSNIDTLTTTNAYVTLWYDQSGNADTAEQATASYQPQIINGGKIDSIDGRPAIRFFGIGSYTYLKTINNVSIAGASTANAVARDSSTVTSGGECIVSQYYNNNNLGFALGHLPYTLSPANEFNYGIYNQNGSGWTNNLTVSTSNFPVGTFIATGTYGGTALNMYANGQNFSSVNTATSGLVASYPAMIGSRWSTGNYFNGYIPELFIFPSELPIATRQTLEQNQSAYYNIPVISTQPSTISQTVCVNGTVTAYTVATSCSSTGLSYQWYSNTSASTVGGTSLGSANGAQTATYTPSTTTVGTLYYYAVLTNAYGSVTSSLSGGVTVGLIITTQPSITNQNLLVNATATTLSVVVYGTGITYQWYRNTTNTSTGGTAISGATGSTYTPSTASVGTLYFYCVVTAGCGVVTSNVSGGIAVVGLDNIGLSSTATSAGYSLRLLSSAYTGPLVRINISGTYYDVYPDASTNKIFSLTSPISAPVTTAYNAASGGATSNQLSSIISGNTATVALWYDQSGNADTAVQSITAYQPEIINTGVIDTVNGLPSVTFTNATQQYLSSTKNTTIKTVNAVRNLVSTGFQYLFSSPALFDNYDVRCSGSFNGSTNLSYASPNGQDLTNNTNPGGTPATWVNGLQTTNGTAALHSLTDTATVATTNSFSISTTFMSRGLTGGDAVSEMIILPAAIPTATRQSLEANQGIYYGYTVAVPPSFTTQPSTAPQSLCSFGAPATALTVSATSSSPFTYQWYYTTSNSNIGGFPLGGANSTSFTPLSSLIGTYYYYCVASNASGSSTSNVSGAVTVTASVTPTISIVASANPIVSGTSVTFTATVANGGTSPGFNWLKNSYSVSTGSNTYLDASILNSDYVSCILTSNATCATTTSATATISMVVINPLDKSAGLPALTNLSAAYSLRLLSNAYTGKAINVRRSSDNTTQDIGFTTNGDLDTTSLKTFVGSGNGFVTIWYDQSGAANNAIQTTTTAQPQIVNAGIIYRANGKPTITFQNTAQYMLNTNNATLQTVNAVRNLTTTSGFQYLLSAPANTDFSVRTNSNSTTYSSPNGNDWEYGTSPNALWVGGVQTLTGTTALQTITANSNAVLANTSFSISNVENFGTVASPAYRGLTGGEAISELTLFSSSLTTAQREALEDGQGTYYSISVTNIPIITSQPSNSSQFVCSGSTVIPLSVTATGSGLTYQWYSNQFNSNSGGTLVTGATSSNYSPSSAATSTLYYYVVVTSGGASVTSSVSGPVIVGGTVVPANSIVASSTLISSGTSVTFTATPINGGTSPSYQWYKNNNAVGVNSSTYTDAGLSNNDYIYCTLTSSATCSSSPDTAASNGITITVLNNLNNVGLNSTVNATAAYSLRLMSSSYTGPLVRIAMGSFFYDVYPDASSSKMFSVNSPISAPYTLYNATATGATSNLLSSIIGTNSATVAIWYDQSGYQNNAIQATTAAQPLLINLGTINTVNGLPALTFTSYNQYLLNTSNAASIQTVNAVRNLVSNGSQYLFSAPANTDFSIRSNPSYSSTSNQYYYWYNANPLVAQDWAYNTGTPPTNWVNGVQTVIATSSLHTITASTQTALTNTSFSVSSNFSSRGMTGGDALSELTVFPAALSSANRKTLEVNQANYYNLLAITSQPASATQTVCFGGTILPISVTATGGSATLTYQWFSSTTNSNVGGTLINGATTASYTPSNTVASSLFYYVIVTSSLGGTITSNVSGSVTVYATAAPTVTLTTTPACLGVTSLTITANLTNAGTYPILQWQKNGVNIAGATGATYIYTPTNGDVISCVLTHNSPCATSTTVTGSITIALNALPTFTLQPSTSVQSDNYGAASTPLSVTVSAGSGTLSSYAWYSNTSSSNTGGSSVANINSTTATYTYIPLTTSVGTLYYYTTVTNSNGCSATSNISGAVNVNPIAPIIGPLTIATSSYGSSFNITSPTSNSGGGFTYTSSNTNVATITGSTLKVVGVGTCVITATQAANGVYTTGSVSVNFTSTKAALTITANAQIKIYNTSLTSPVTGSNAFTTIGLATWDAIGSVTLTYSSPALLTAAPVGTTSTITPSAATGGTFNASNYTISYVSGTLAVVASTITNTGTTPSTAAYSLRLVNTSYAGKAINVRRSSDNTTLDIGFTANGDLDTTALKTFVGSGNGYVVIWYDQSGNANNATQSTTTYQPQVVNAGTVLRNNCEPAVYFNGNYLPGSKGFPVGSDYTINAVVSQTAVSLGNILGSVTGNHALYYNNTTSASLYHSGLLATAPSTPLSSIAIQTAKLINNTLTGTVYTNGTAGTSASTTTAAAGTDIEIGAYQGGNFLTGYISEILVFPTALSDANRQTLESNQELYYSLPLFTSQPSTTSQSICLGGTGTAFSVTTTASNTAYQWYQNTTNSNVGGTLISGANVASYAPSPASAGTYYYYVVVATCGTSNTSNVSGAVTVNAVPAVSAQPATSTQSVFYGGNTTALNVTATAGSGTISGYQWYRNASNSNSGGTAISGATTTSYTPVTSALGTTYYYVVISNSNGCTTASNASGSIIISAATPVVTIVPGTYTYTGTAQGPANAVTSNTGTGNTYTFSYAGTGATSYGPSSTLPTNVGTYTATATVAATTNYTSATATATAFTIGKAALTIVASAQSKAYATTLTSPVTGSALFTATGLVNGETIGSVTLSFGAAALPATASIGTTSIITPSAATSGTFNSNNYNLSYTNGLLTVIAGTANTWVGILSNNYSTAGNWGDANVPGNGANINIPAGTPYAPIQTTNITVGNLSIASGASIGLGGQTLTINGVVSGSGSLTSTPASKLIIGGAAGTLNFTTGNDSIQALTLNSNASATLGTKLNMVAGTAPGIVTINAGATLNTGSNLVLKSDCNGTARIAQLAGSIAGNVTAERYISPKSARKFSYIGSPVTTSVRNSWQQQIYVTGAGTGGVPCGTTTGDGGSNDKYNSNGFDVTQNNAATIYKYNATLVNGSRYVGIANTESTNLSPGTGYCVNIRGNRNSNTVNCVNQLESNTPAAPEAVTLSATGPVTTGDLSVTLNNPSVYAFTLLANPYPCQISFSAFQASNSNINNNMWTYSPFGNNNYTTYSNGIIANGASSYDNTSGNYIASGQAFFVQANAPGSVTFHESHKTNGALPGTQYFGTDVNRIIRIGLKDNSETSLLDEIVVRYNSNGSDVYTQGWDASSLSSGSQILASLKGTKRLAIATHGEVLTTDTTKLYIKSSAVGSFKLSFSDFKDLDNTQSITLIDKFLNTTQDMRANQVYAFNVTSDTTSMGYNRFAVVVGAASTLPVNFTSISATKEGEKVNVRWSIANEVNIASYEVERSTNGTSFSTVTNKKAVGTTSYAIEDASIPAIATTLYYRIKAIGTDGTTRYSAIAKLITHNSSLSTIAVYPNPVKSKLNISLGAASGNYDVRITSVAGKEVIGKSAVTVTDGKLSLDASSLAAGVYVVELTDKEGNKYQEKFVKE